MDIERGGECVRSTVSYVAQRYRCLGELGLEDGRQYNGSRKFSEAVLMRLAELIRDTPQRFRWARPTWTRELLVIQFAIDTGVRLSVTTLSRLLKRMGARWGRGRNCPPALQRTQQYRAALKADSKVADFPAGGRG